MTANKFSIAKIMAYSIIFVGTEGLALYYEISLIRGNINLPIIFQIMRHFFYPAFFHSAGGIPSSSAGYIAAKNWSGMLFLELLKVVIGALILLGLVIYYERTIKPITKSP